MSDVARAKGVPPGAARSQGTAMAMRHEDENSSSPDRREEEEKAENAMQMTKSNASAAAAQMSPVREVLFVTVICMAQFLTQSG